MIEVYQCCCAHRLGPERSGLLSTPEARNVANHCRPAVPLRKSCQEQSQRTRFFSPATLMNQDSTCGENAVRSSKATAKVWRWGFRRNETGRNGGGVKVISFETVEIVNY